MSFELEDCLTPAPPLTYRTLCYCRPRAASQKGKNSFESCLSYVVRGHQGVSAFLMKVSDPLNGSYEN